MIKKPLLLIQLLLTLPAILHGAAKDDVAAIKHMGQIVQQAFRDQDIDTILKYHHPEVRKVFSWENYQIGHKGMRGALEDLFENYQVEFRNEGLGPPNLEVLGDSAVMIRDFVLVAVPKHDKVEAFEYKGRTMIVFVRSSESPTGWVTFREMAIPADS